MLLVRADIVSRIDSLAAQRGHANLVRTCDELDGIRHIARNYGLEAVERLASMLGSALALDGVGPVVLTYLDLMRDAAASETNDADVSDACIGLARLRTGS